MASTYSTNLGFELPGTGDQAGTWGITNNTNIGTLIEQAISGYATCSIADAGDTTITIPNGASGEARNMSLELTGTLSATRNLLVPAKRKLYFIFNNTSGGFAVTVRVAGQPGVSVPNGQKMILVCNGTDVVTALSYAVTMSTTSLSLTANTSTPAGVFIHRPANDTIGFGVGGTERMRLDASGNFGIGTASPTQRLHVNGSTIVPIANSYFTFDVRFGIGTPDSSGLQIFTGDLIRFGTRTLGGVFTERMTLDSSGNLGIGTASPVGRTDTVSNATAAFVARASTTGANQTVNALNAYNADASLFALAKYNAVQHIWGYAGATEGMRLNASGNLGIGTTNPIAPLVVSNAGAAGIELNPSGGPGGGAYLNSYNRGTSAFIPWTNYASVHTWFVGTAGGTRAMDLDSSGNLGIGTASPSYRLDVVGASTIPARFKGNGTISAVILSDNNTVTEGYVGSVGDDIRIVAGSSEVIRARSSGSVTAGLGSRATTATDGFLYVPTCAGTPTGTPTNYGGFAPLVVNTTNNKLYFYSGGAWRDAGP